MFKCYYTPPAKYNLKYNLGHVRLIAEENALLSLTFVDVKSEIESKNSVLEQCCDELDEYFNGKRKTFGVPLRLYGTDFRIKVWNTLQTIPYGEIWTYKQLAEVVEDMKYSRAVGNANGKNPISIIVPCHRIIGSNQSLTGYAWGVHRKDILLSLEKNYS